MGSVVNREHRVRDFLQRCLESPFSRKLDLWSYLDLPRSRLVKYPLLLKNILKATPEDHHDTAKLVQAIQLANDVIGRIDEKAGERKSIVIRNKFEYLHESQRNEFVENSRSLLLSGQLKGGRGTKLTVFLFDLALVLTRNASRSDRPTFQVYRKPLPLHTLSIETDDSTGKSNGSFRGGIKHHNDKVKPTFRVRSEDGVSYTLTAADEHDRKQWINALQDGISKATAKKLQQKTKLTNTVSDSDFVVKTSKTEPAVLLRRSSSVKLPQELTSPAASRNRSKTLGHHVTPPCDDKTPSKTLQGVAGDQNTEHEKTPSSSSSFSKLRRRLSLRLSTGGSGEIERSPNRKSRSLTSSPVVSRMDSSVVDDDNQHSNKQKLRQCVSLPNTQAKSSRRERYLTRSRSLARVDDLSIVLEDEQIPATVTGITPETERLSTSLLNLSTETPPDIPSDVKVAWEESTTSSSSEDHSLMCQQVLTELINTVVCNDTANKKLFTRTISRVELREVRPPTALETQV